MYLIILAGIVIITGVVLSKKISDVDITKSETEITENTVKEEFVEILEDGTKVNTSNKLKETKTYEGLEISNIKLTEKDNVTLLLGTVTNKTNTKQGGKTINIKMIDKKGNEIITIVAFVGEIKEGESTKLNVSTTFNFVNAYDLSISN